MALGQIHKGVRELIRVTMRERGIKHRSTPKEICSVCYAQQPTMTVEYNGPIFFTYEEPIVHIHCYGHIEDIHYFESSFPHAVRSQSNFSDFRSYRNEKYLVGKTGIDIHDPKFCDILGEFLDKHVPDENKRPAKWKRIFQDTDNEYYFVATKEHRKENRFITIRQAIARWVMLKFFGIDPVDYDWYWREAIKRHFRCNSDDIQQITQTVHALEASKLSREEIEHNTTLIMDDQTTEY